MIAAAQNAVGARLPLQGYRVLDITTALAGPFASMFMSVLGAEVIKIGRTQDGARAPGRRFSGTSFQPSTDGYSQDVNINKKSILLDLKRPEAIEIVKRLARESDAVVENYRAGVLDRLGIGYEQLREIKRDIIMLAISSGGATGPDRDDRGYAAVFAALSGFSELMGYADGAPIEFRGQCDMVCGTFGAFALLAALTHRKLTGEGQLIDASNREMLSLFIGEVLSDYLVNRRSQRRDGNRHVAWTPNEVYRCAGDDRWISITVTNDDQWQGLAELVGGPRLADDERFADGFLRWKNRDDLDQEISAWTNTVSDVKAMNMLRAVGVPAAPVLHPPDALADSHLEARNWWRILEMGEDRTPHIMAGRAPWLLSKTPCEDYRPGSAPGTDTDSVLAEALKMSDSEIAQLREKGIIR